MTGSSAPDPTGATAAPLTRLLAASSVIDLSRPIDSSTPASPHHAPSGSRCCDVVREGGVSGSDELISMCVSHGFRHLLPQPLQHCRLAPRRIGRPPGA